MKVHEKIRFLREEKELSQEEMAKRLHMSVNGYSRIERGETKAYIPKLEKIADVLDVDLIELIPLEGKTVYLFSHSNSNNTGDGCHIFNSEAEVVFENEKLQLMLELKDKELAMQQREIAYLKELLEMHKNSKSNLAE
jgi:transcriptional regulator with XRE-family HTH domain